MNRPSSSRSRSFQVLFILSLFVIVLSILPGNAQAALRVAAQASTQAATMAATQAGTQVGTQAPSGPVLDKLNPGESKLGTISVQVIEDRYEISVKAKDQLRMGVTGDEGFLPSVELHTGTVDKPGTELANGIPTQGFLTSLVLNYTIPKDGTYVVVVKPGLGKTSKVGRFVITFALITFKVPVNGTVQGDVLPANGFPLTGSVQNTTIRTVYKYDGKQGDKLLIQVVGVNGLIPAVSIQKDTYSDDGIPVASAEAPPSSSNPGAQLDYQLPADGSYYIVVTHATSNKGNSAGLFVIALTVNGASVQDQLTPTNNFAQPAKMPDTIDTAGDPNVMVGRLHDQGLVPDGGILLANIPANLFVEASTPGAKIVPLSFTGDVSARNFVANIQVSWTQIGDQSGCGVGFWFGGATDYSVALLDNTGVAFLIQENANGFTMQYAEPSTFYTPGKTATITLIVIGDTVSYYINGHLQTTQQGKSKYGTLTGLLLNSQKNTKLTICTFPYGWVWRF